MTRRSAAVLCAVAVFGALAALGNPALAQDRRAPDPTDPDFVGAALGDLFEVALEGDERVLYAVGGVSAPVWIRQPGFELRCESVVIWGVQERDVLLSALERRPSPEGTAPHDAREILGPVIHAIYAEGGVFLQRTGQTIRAERIFIDFAQNRAYLVRAEVTGNFGSKDGRAVPLSVRADVVRGIAENRFRAEDPSFTTCSYDDPHFRFTSTWIEVDFTEEYVGFETGWWPKLRVDTPLGDDMPVLVLPKIGGRTFETRPLQNIDLGSTGRFGTSIGLVWGGHLNDSEGTRKGDWRARTDWRSARGAGLGLEVAMRGPAQIPGGPRDELEIGTYFQRDTARQDEFSERAFDGRRGGDTPNDRGRAWAWFRQHGGERKLLPEGWRLDGELSYYSDRGFIPEFERDLALTKKQQETYVGARYLSGNEGFSIQASARANGESAALIRSPLDLLQTDYEAQTEYLPSLTYHVINERLLSPDQTGFAPLNVSVQASGAQVRRRYDERLESLFHSIGGWQPERVLRGDVETRFTAPFALGPVRFNPSFGGSYMAVDGKNGFATNNNAVRDDDADARRSGFYGLRVGSEVHRRFDVESSTLGLHGLRHVMSVDAQYFDRFVASQPSFTFQTNDLIDELDEVEMGSLRVRNRLQTKRDGKVVDWLDYELRFLNFFDDFRAAPSVLGFREDLPQPLQRLDFPGQDKYAARARHGGAFHQHRLRWQFLRDVWLVGEGDYDMDVHDFETVAAGVRWNYDERLTLYAGRRTIINDSIIWTLRGDYRLTDKWALGVQQQENTQNERRFDTKVTLYRRSHDLTIALEFESDNQLNETSLAIAIYPNDWLSTRSDPFTQKRQLDYAAWKWYR